MGDNALHYFQVVRVSSVAATWGPFDILISVAYFVSVVGESLLEGGNTSKRLLTFVSPSQTGKLSLGVVSHRSDHRIRV